MLGHETMRLGTLAGTRRAEKDDAQLKPLLSVAETA